MFLGTASDRSCRIVLDKQIHGYALFRLDPCDVPRLAKQSM